VQHEDPNNPNCIAAGISGGVCVNHLWPVVAGGGGMKDEALKLASALDHWATQMDMGRKPDPKSLIRKASAELRRLQAELDAIKQALALDKMADNARELGLDYEPADGTQVSKVWWDGEKLMAKPIPLVDFYQPVQEPVGLIDRLTNPEQHYEFTDPKKANAVLMSLCQEAADALAAQPAPVQEPVWIQPDHLQKAQKAPFLCRVEPHKRDDFVPLHTTPPAQPAPVPLTDDQKRELIKESELWDMHIHMGWYSAPSKSFVEKTIQLITTIEAKLKEKNAAAQPAVPDAFGTREGEHPQYIQGWNDCRAEMLKGMKP
jgi:hypothetical protein